MTSEKDHSPGLEQTTTRHSHINPPPELLANDADAELLGKRLSRHLSRNMLRPV